MHLSAAVNVIYSRTNLRSKLRHVTFNFYKITFSRHIVPNGAHFSNYYQFRYSLYSGDIRYFTLTSNKHPLFSYETCSSFLALNFDTLINFHKLINAV